MGKKVTENVLRPIQLEIDGVHVCCVSLDNFLFQAQTLSKYLSIYEKKRADRYYFAKDKKRYIIIRGILRQIISTYLNIAPGKIEFSYGLHGKPALSSIGSKICLCFNVAHSNGLALFAFTLDRQVGVDIEFIRNIQEMDQIVKRFFSAKENYFFFRLSTNMKKKAFFQMWTRKEAFLKATGKGLHQSLETFDVTTVPGKIVNSLKTKEEINTISEWSFKDLNPHPNFAAAFAVQGLTKHCWIDWTIQPFEMN